MNRKLRNTILAFSVTGMALAVGLMAAQPVLSGHAGPAGAVAHATVPASTQSTTPTASGGPGDALAAATPSAPIRAGARQFRAALVDAESLERAIAATFDFVAAVATQGVPAAALADDEAEATASGPEEASAARSRRNGSVRSAIAVPYF